MPLAATPLGKGCAAKNAAVATVSALRPLNKVCDRQTHTDTTVHNTHGNSDRDTPQAVRSTARHVSPRVPTSVHSRVSSFHRHPPRPSSLGYAVQSLGMCCEERSSCDSQRAPFAHKVCDSQTHTDTTVHNGHSFLPSFLQSVPHHTESAARRVMCGT